MKALEYLERRERRAVWRAVSEVLVPYWISFFYRRSGKPELYKIRVKSTGMRIAMMLRITGQSRFPIVDSVLLRRLGLYEPNTSIVLREELKAGCRVIELGAAYGYFTIQMARYCGPFGRVYAFEPCKEHFELLSRNIQINSCENVTMKNVALGRGGHVFVDGCGGQFETESLLGFMSSLEEDIDFVFIDVDARNLDGRAAVRQEEGLVGDLLEYASKTGQKPKLFLEYPGDVTDMARIRVELTAFGYKAFRISRRHCLFK